MDTKQLNSLRETVFFVSLLLTVAAFPFSEALISIFSGWLLLQALLLRSWNHPMLKTRSLHDLLIISVIFAVYLVGVVFTEDLNLAGYEMKKVIFWVIIPSAFYFSPPLSLKKTYVVLNVFVASVLAGSILFTAKFMLLDNPLSHEIRTLGIISNIRFSFQVILALIIVAWFFYIRFYKNSYPLKFIWAVTFIWLTGFLFILQSLLGIFAFMATVSVALLYFLMQLKNRSLKMLVLTVLFLLILVPAIYLYRIIMDFYRVEIVNPDTVEYITPSGNIYQHDFDNKASENGNLIYVYICHDELRQEWNKRSNIKYDDLLGSYPVSITLIRYLTSMGYRKDSAAVANLSDKDIHLINQGVTNYRFKNHFASIYPRIYETIWELDYYFKTGDPNNKSLAQRIEYLKASLILIRQNPVFGIGTGNWVRKYNEVYDSMDTKLHPDKRASSHNQYLNYLVKFGMAGLLIIVAALLIPLFRNGHKTNFIFLFFLISIGLANLGDANLESHMGLTFFIFFYSFFLWNSTRQMKGLEP
jgi:hypothetical protein